MEDLKNFYLERSVVRRRVIRKLLKYFIQVELKKVPDKVDSIVKNRSVKVDINDDNSEPKCMCSHYFIPKASYLCVYFI